jgi:hypothetical protein
MKHNVRACPSRGREGAGVVPLPHGRGSAPSNHLQHLWLAVIVLFCVSVCVLAISAECLYLRDRREARTIALANQLVESRLATARAHLDLHHWDEAIDLLEDARAQDHATNQDEVRALLVRARQGQAAALLENVAAAVQRKDADAALRLLRDYLAHPQATDPQRATSLQQEIEWAVSDEKAADWLARLSDSEFTLFVQRNELTAETPIRTEGVRVIFKDTLRRQLPRETRRREAKRQAEQQAVMRRAAERALQETRIRSTPAFRLVSTFVAEMRQKNREVAELAQREEKALVQLFQQLNVNDPAEQAKVRATLKARDPSGGNAATIDRRRAEAKQAYRTSPEFDPADREVFDQLVDRELDQLRREMGGS